MSMQDSSSEMNKLHSLTESWLHPFEARPLYNLQSGSNDYQWHIAHRQLVNVKLHRLLLTTHV
jgi:hypothetical protein